MGKTNPGMGEEKKKGFPTSKGDEYLKNIVLQLLKSIHIAGAGQGDSISLVLG